MIFNTVLSPEWSTAVFFLFSDSCSWVPCLFWTVKLPAILQKNPSGPTNYLVFLHFCVFEPFPTMTVWFLRSIFSHWGQLRDSYTTITEGSNTHWCSTMKNHALRARGWKLLNRMEMCTFLLILPKDHIFSFRTALQRLQKIIACFPEDKIS